MSSSEDQATSGDNNEQERGGSEATFPRKRNGSMRKRSAVTSTMAYKTFLCEYRIIENLLLWWPL